MAWVHGVSLLLLMTTSSLAMYIQNGQPQLPPQPPPRAQPCASGDACLKSFSRSYVNNVVLCCLNGEGLSVGSFGTTVHCECGSGVMNFNGGSFLVNGQLQNHPLPNNGTNGAFNTMMTNFQQQMTSFRQQMESLGTSLQNVFNGLW